MRWLTEDDWAVLRGVRLQALADAPDAFTSTVDREEAFPPDIWRTRSANAVIVADGDTAVGMASYIVEEERAQLVGMWVAPESRSTGAAAAIVDAMRARAEADGLPLWLCVYTDNVRARRFYERCGFTADGEMCDANGTRTLLQMTLSRSPDRLSGN